MHGNQTIRLKVHDKVFYALRKKCPVHFFNFINLFLCFIQSLFDKIYHDDLCVTNISLPSGGKIQHVFNKQAGSTTHINEYFFIAQVCELAF